MSPSPSEELRQSIISFARATEVPEESFLMGRFALDDSEQLHKIIDGLTLSLISFCYHRHPRGENVHEVMEMIEAAGTESDEIADLERRADDAAALQIPFIVTLNRLLEEYYELRRALERRLQGIGDL